MRFFTIGPIVAEGESMATEVLVVGAGPTGLMLAGWLAREGVRVRVIDRKSGPTAETRALAVQARTLETYDFLGLGERALSQGVEVKSANIWVHGRTVGKAQFSELGKGMSPHPMVFILGQDRNERLLLDHLEAHGGEVEWNTALEGMQQDGSGITATIRRPDGSTETTRTRYLCGCDGASSTVRHALWLGFPGGTYASRFFVADVVATGQFDESELNLCFEEERFLAVFPLRGQNHVRLVGILPDALAGRDDLTFEDVRPDVEPRFSLRVQSVGWFSTYRVHHRVVEHFQKGRAFLLGDAGHVHSPVGGQGMITGLMDAANLAWKLALVVEGRTDERILATYEPERIPFARTLEATTDRIFSAVITKSSLGRSFRRHVFPRLFAALTHSSFIRHRLFELISQTRVHYPESPLSRGRVGSVHGGERLPWVAYSDGTTNYGPLTKLRPQVHVYGRVAPELVRFPVDHPDIMLVRLPFTPDVARAGLVEGAGYFVRPDGYLGYIASPWSDADFRTYLREAWGFRPEPTGMARTRAGEDRRPSP
jgi:2-polyprenyl-6-methoxyphenol hydroxylase-like FAD-dependent oxidoreductase